MGPIERAVLVAGAIGLVIAGFMLVRCTSNVARPGFDMQACALPAIPQIAVPNFRLIAVLAVIFAGIIIFSRVFDQGF